MQAEVGATVELRDVLLVSNGGEATVGTPVVNGAAVVAEVLEHGRDAKVLVFKYKNKTRYRRRYGHRQDFTRLAIRDILVDGKPSKKEADEEKPKKRATKRPTKGEAASDETPTEAAASAPEEEAVKAPAPKARRPRSPKATAEGEVGEPSSGAADAEAAAEEPEAEATGTMGDGEASEDEGARDESKGEPEEE
jgi:large subunit ribosomal protein L21